MNETTPYIGVDVSKAKLDFFVPGDGESGQAPNTAGGCRQIVGMAKKLGLRVCCEPTGGYEQALVRACWDDGVEVSLTDAWRVRHFAKGRGILEKTDAIDAKVIALFAAENRPRPFPRPSETQRRLRDLTRAMESIGKQIQIARGNLEHCGGNAEIAKLWKRNLAFLERSRCDLEAKRLATVRDDSRLCGLFERFQLVKGVGPATALAMLAECSDGNTREEILSALGADDMASLRKSAAALLAADNYDDGTVTSLIANSLWFNKEHYFNADTVGRLAELYRASTYWGDPTDPDYEKELQNWLKDNTGGLLDDSADKIEMDPLMLLEICSTVCFKGGWGEGFKDAWYAPMEFHGTAGDTEVPCMYKQVHEGGRFWYGDGYKAAIDTIGTSGNSMIYLLPNEGVSIETMLKSINTAWLLANAKTGKLTITAPKFDVSSDNDLIPALREIGINDCFGPAADLSQLTDNSAYVSEVRHSARVTVDENGISAAAFTQVELTLSMGEMSLTLDRPFVFIVTGVTGAPLFIGVVNNIA